MYEETTNLWRPFDQLNILLIYIATFALIVIFVGTYRLLVRPKSLAVGLEFGAFIGLAIGIAVGLGTYIHMPIPQALAWGWFMGACLKFVVAGGFVGMLIRES